ncbi:AraC family transcriptional regulator [Xylophilus sp. GW821-FHT01B05]
MPNPTVLTLVPPADAAAAEQWRLDQRMTELAALILRHSPGDGLHATSIPRLQLVRLAAPQLPICGIYTPSVCILAQGRKRVTLGNEVYVYDRSRYIVGAVGLTVTGEVVDATPEQPYLCFRLDFDPRQIAEMVLELGLPMPAKGTARGLFLENASLSMVDAAVRLISLLDTPEDIGALAPLAERELLYRLLRSAQGWRLIQAATQDTHAHRIDHAIRWLQERFTEPLRIDVMAEAAHMSSSALHHHFKAVTALSPLQYQKRLRLQEARRLLMAESLDAATAGHRVGYESPSQFSREYARLFGAPPARDLQRMREQNAPLAIAS